MVAANAQISDVLRRYAAALVLEGADRFKVKAYRRAAETIETLDADVAELVDKGVDLKSLPGIGKAISGAISEIVTTGSMRQLDEFVSRADPELIELADWPRLDPKKTKRIYKKLQISSIDELRQRLASGQIREVFGTQMAFHIRRGLDERPRMLLYSAEPLAERIRTFLESLPDVIQAAAVGSLRRKCETVGDLNFLVASQSAAALFRQFSEYGSVQETQRRSRTEASFRLSAAVAVTLHWTRQTDWPVQLLLTTGSEEHVAQLRTRATARKMSLSSAGLRRQCVATENDLYSAIGLQYIEPELREGRGEVEAAAEGRLPRLITRQDLQGDLHMHTTASDGGNSIEDMAAAARQMGYRYIAITDHSRSLRIANGLSEARLLEQIRQIDALNERRRGITILKSAEVDILEDGSLDYSNAVLKELDFTICSIHSRFGLDREQQTARILRAMDNPYFNILGHATGRLLLRREGYELDMQRVLAHARDRGCFVEINSSPDRLDLSDEHARMAKDLGVLVAIDTDAHSTQELEFIAAGLNQARRAWLEPSQVLNTLPLAELRKRFRRA